MKNKVAWSLLLVMVALTLLGGCQAKTPAEIPLDSLEDHLFVVFICTGVFSRQELQNTVATLLEYTEAEIRIATLPGGRESINLNLQDQEHIYPVYQLLEIDPATVDGFVVVGGNTIAHVEDQALLDYVRALDQQGTVMGAMCAGPIILGASGVLQGKKAGGSVGNRQRMEAYGVVWSSEPLQITERYVTAWADHTSEMVIEMVRILSAQKAGK